MDKLKEQLIKSLYRYLESNLDPSVRASVTTQHQLEILRCVADWVHKDSEMLEKIAKARKITEAMKAKREAGPKPEAKPDPEDSLFQSPEFMDELEKL